MNTYLVQLVCCIGLLVISFQTAEAQWKQTMVPEGVDSSSIVTCLSAAGGALVAGAGGQFYATSVFASSDNGLHWTPIAPGFANDTGNYSLDWRMPQGGAVFARINPNSSRDIFLSTNGGASWTHVESGLENYLYEDKEFYSFTSSANGLFIGTWIDIIRSIDGGVTWSRPDSTFQHPIYSLISKSGRIIAGSEGGVFVSSDSGKSWKKSPFGLMSMHVAALAMCGDALFAGSSYNGVFRSTDDGANWKAVNSGLTNTSVFSLISHDSTLFAGTFGSGVFMSIDKGTTWRPFNTGIPEMRVYSLAVSGQELFAGTEAYWVWHRPLSEAGVISDRPPRNESSMPLHCDIRIPSSLISCLTIAFSLPRPDHVSISLHDPSGRMVMRLVNESLSAGSYSYRWDSHAIARGCYVVSIRQANTYFSKIVRLLQ